MSKRVLFIAYNFPPAGGAGVQRSLKFIKYLPEWSWQPIVVTTTPDAYPVHDESLWADVPARTPVYRVKGYDVNGLRPRFTHPGLAKLLAALNVALMLPDAALFWARLARTAVRRAVAQHQPCLIYSSSGPASVHLLGLWAKQTFDMLWVADFRDPWSENRLIPYYPGYRAINRRMERRVLNLADRIVTVSEPLAADLSRLSKRGQPPVLVIENGYDDEEVVPLPPRPTERFTITYTGAFSRLRRPGAFITAVEQLTASGQIPLDQIRVIIAGKDTARHVPDRPPFERSGYLSHDALSGIRAQTDLFLFLQDNLPESQGAYSAKLFEYLGSNRPTLAITYPGNVGAQLVECARAGRATHYDPPEIAAAILHFYRAWQTGEFDYAPDWTIIRQYTRRNLTARLAAEFNRLVDSEAAV